MRAVNYNFDIEQGSNFNLSFIYNDVNGSPINLTNKCVVFSLLGSDGTKRVYSNKALSDYNTNGWSLTANNLGIIELKLSAEETKDFIFPNAVYDLDIKETDTDKINNIRLSEGSITIIGRNIALSSGCPVNLNSLVQTALPAPTTTGEIPSTPTPTPVVTDLCLPYDCGPIDIFSVVYNGSGLNLYDVSSTTGSITVTNTGLITNVELAINKLNHTSPTDLVMLLAPPSGNKVLLSANQKIPNLNNNFSFMFSNKADNNKYLHNIMNGEVCRIYDKIDSINYNNETLSSSFDHLFNNSITGVWNLIIKDTDPLGSGNIDSWKLVITYDSSITENI